MAANEATAQANRSGLDPKRLVVMFYLVAGAVLAMFLGNVLEPLWAQVGWRNPEVIEGLDIQVTTLLGVGLAVALGAFALWNPRLKQLSLEVASELMKVTWPSWAETRVSTVAVVIASLVAAVILYGMDMLSYQVMVEWLPKFWGKL
ncbi:MAG: preprotein translocase subunit SecE [Myxococcales bacterium]|nr:preprotein translocase subunit SecE [Myxococcales bacterium]